MRSALFLALLASAPLSHADVYRWVDENGVVNYSNAVPHENAKASTVGIADARGGFVSSDPLPCSARCQGERYAPQLARREAANAEEYAQRAELAPPPARGLDFRRFVSLREGMSEGELLAIAGAPDLQRRERSFDIYTYMPTPADPFVTTITLLRGKVQDLDRVRKF
ncbi:MAG TPA: DUF4124 domain-containing protein [Burkholderiales bacterium]|nr:DUF4124 domain-containing protein [Burkholderiales bacterium]